MWCNRFWMVPGSVLRPHGQPFPPAVEAAMAKEWNPSHFSLRIVPKLKDLGVTDEQIDALLVDNPRRFFAGDKLPARS